MFAILPGQRPYIALQAGGESRRRRTTLITCPPQTLLDRRELTASAEVPEDDDRRAADGSGAVVARAAQRRPSAKEDVVTIPLPAFKEIKRDGHGQLVQVRHRASKMAVVEPAAAAMDKKQTTTTALEKKKKEKNETQRKRPPQTSKQQQRQHQRSKNKADTGNQAASRQRDIMPLAKTAQKHSGAWEALTPAEDAQLLSLKVANKTWREIAKEMKKPQDVLRARFKVLSKDRNKVDVDGGGGGVGGERGRTGAPAAAAAGNGHSASGDKDKTNQALKINNDEDLEMLMEDDLFTYQELKLLAELLLRHRGEKSWRRIASAFFDTTGRRVHPLDIESRFHACV